MKSILEQSFSELYAQVEERVKCIKPVKQIDTFTKTLMWTSINEILMDVFGGSRFMWMILDDRESFSVQFVDRYRTVLCKEIVVPYVIPIERFEWPESVDCLRHMSYEELQRFSDNCNERGITNVDIGRHYGQFSTWFNTMLRRRKRGSLSREKWRTTCDEKIRAWDAKKITCFKLAYLLKKHDIPICKYVFMKITDCDSRVYGYARAVDSTESTFNAAKSIHDIDHPDDDTVKLFSQYVNEIITQLEETICPTKRVKHGRAFNQLFGRLGVRAQPVYTDSCCTAKLIYSEDSIDKIKNYINKLKTLTTKEVKND
ncbi:MAG: hypothetical protein IKA36_05265 [Clostridia bacterium]|nr:hypothetical protein [Clostridia bacterium]